MSVVGGSYELRDQSERKVVRGLCIYGDKLLAIRRQKQGEHFIVIPGGGVEQGQKERDAVEREVLEETSIEVSATSCVLTIPYNSQKDFPETIIWLVDYISGQPMLDPNSEEAQRSKDGKNTYQPCWVSIEEAMELIVPIELREYLKNEIIKRG